VFPNNLGFPTRARQKFIIMGRYATYPTTIDDLKTITLTKLKEWGYLTTGERTGTITWSRNGEVYSSIGIKLVFTNSTKYLLLDYKCNGEAYNYKVYIQSKPSNLGFGEVLYFVCPSTRLYCRKLYFSSGYFLHRKAFSGLMYENQIASKKTRYLHNIFDRFYLPDSLYEERYKKYFKTHYNGKPTKRYLKLENKIKISESYPPDTLERLMLM